MVHGVPGTVRSRPQRRAESPGTRGAACAGPCCAAPGAGRVSRCRQESLRLEANKRAARRMLQLVDNPVLALREYRKAARDVNASINLHNALCKPFRVTPLPT